jgi:hypothetical protein
MIDAGIIIRGGIGTNVEYSLMLRHAKIIGVALGTGGVADSIYSINERLKNGTAQNHIFYCNPCDKPEWINGHNYKIVNSPKELIKAIFQKYINH